VKPIFLKIGGYFTHLSAQKVSNFILFSLMVFYASFHALYLEKFVIIRKSENERDFFIFTHSFEMYS
jgi:hypothetical protein